MIETFTGVPTEPGLYVARWFNDRDDAWEVVEVVGGSRSLIVQRIGREDEDRVEDYRFRARIHLDKLPLL